MKKVKHSIFLKIMVTTLSIIVVIISLFALLKCDLSATIQGGIVDDGVYALKNKATGQYLDIQNDSPLVNMYIQQYAYGSVPSTNSTRSGLFKLSHRGSNYYLIRTMRNNGNTFYRVSDTEVKTITADPVDSNNPQSLSWCISDAGNGYYYIEAYNTGKYLCTPATGINQDKYCTTESYATAGDRAKWELIEYTGSTISGISFITYISSVYMESSTQFEAYMWSTDMSNNGPIIWGVHNSTSWSLPCSATISSTGVLQTYAVFETLDVSASANIGSTHYIQVDVNPPIETGLYAIKNTYSNMYMDIRENSYNPNAFMQQYSMSTIPHTESDRSSLYKVEWLGSGNAYTIRTMTNNMNGFKPQTNSIGSDIRTCGFSDSTTWYITRDSQGRCVIKNGGNTNSFAIGVKNSTSSGASGRDNSKLELTNTQSDKAKWMFIEPEDLIPFSALKVVYLKPQIIDEGSSTTMCFDDLHTKYFYSTNMNINTCGTFIGCNALSPSGDISNIAHIDNQNLIGYTGKAGMVSIVASFTNAVSKPFYIYFKPINGEYFFLQNVQSELGCVKSCSTYSQKASFDYDDKQIWKRISNGSGYYYIQNMDGKYLTAPNSILFNIDVGLESSLLTGNDLNRQLWVFDSAPSGTEAYRISSVSMGSVYCLNINSNNGKLVQDFYANNSSYYDEFNVVIMGSDVVYHRTFEEFEPIDISNVVRNIYEKYNGFELVYLQNHLGKDETPANPSACFNIALNMLQNARIAIFAGHGSPSVITVSETDGQYFLRNNHIYNSGTPSNYLSSVDIVFFDGCDTASPPDTGSYNITESAAIAGAKVSIGWTVSVGANNPAGWIDMFFDLMNTINPVTGHLYTAYDAWEYINDNINNDSSNSQIYGTNVNFSFE